MDVLAEDGEEALFQVIVPAIISDEEPSLQKDIATVQGDRYK